MNGRLSPCVAFFVRPLSQALKGLGAEINATSLYSLPIRIQVLLYYTILIPVYSSQSIHC